MIIDLNEVLSDPFADNRVDVCICGAGVAGITLALNLPRTLNVLLLEGGGFKFSAESQSIYQGHSVGQAYYDLSATRQRFLGGTSNHWTGVCRPLDSYDFEPKSFVQYSGWPIRHPDLDPYLEKTESILDLSNNDSWDEPRGSFGKEFDATSDFKRIKFKWSDPPTRFGQKYQEEIEHRSNISCYLNANVTESHLTKDLSRLDHVELRNQSGRVFQVRARIFVLAVGGIENPRILLNSNHQLPAGLGNQNGLVGRFFTEHPHVKVGDFILEDHLREYLEENWYVGSFQERLRSLICGSQWAVEGVSKIRGDRMSCVRQSHYQSLRQFFSPSLEFMERDRILNFGLRFQPNVANPERATDGTLVIASEQAPNPLSRITLASDLDKFGMRRVKLDWQLSRIDLHTIQRAVFRFGQTFADLGLGRVRVSDWLRSDSPQFAGGGGNHHMCTTRMAESSDRGVVDQHQRVFGTDNLYIAGSSVFSTAGHANPTFTIVQMTLRLADHIGSLSIA
jgi:choline dehydrogenase-like flavoprotein